MRKLAPYLAALSLVGCTNDLDRMVERRVAEDLLYEIEGFGWLYRVVVLEGGNERPYLVLGEYEELRKLDEDINPGDMVMVPNEGTKFWKDGNGTQVPAIISVKEVKSDSTLWSLNDRAKQRIDGVLSVINASVNPDPVVVRVPDLFMGTWDGTEIVSRSSIAFSPALANVQVANGKIYFPIPYGPANLAGEDVLRKYIEGLIPTSDFREDWNIFHRREGGVHCGTNVIREIYSVQWWNNIPGTYAVPSSQSVN